QVDIDRLAARLDLNTLINQIDVNAIVDRVDINAVVDRVDIEDLVARTEFGRLVMQSTTGIVTRTLDVARSTGVGLDQFVIRWIDRVLRRPRGASSGGPPRLVEST
ncbi:MAG TPA: hypothetical protein VFA62_06730, partial [Acidimicrobiia bacterium]|nr:hypothetical protein [Acidimicrobiia bacterium]